MSDTPNTLWVKGYTADGYQVGITVAVDPANLAQWITDALNAIREAGVSPRELGTEAGEDVHTLDFVVRRTKKEKDGNRTPIIDLYSNRLTDYRVVGLYLNNEEDVAKFERATGLKVASLQEYPAKAPLERKEDAFADYASAVPTLPQFAIKKNPKWNDNIPPLENDVAKHLFTRWLGAGAPAPVSSTPRTDAALASIDATRKPEYRPENVVNKGGKVTPFAGKQAAATEPEQVFIATVLATIKTKTGKQMFVFKSPDGTQSASTFSLTDVGADQVYDEETMQALHTWGDRELEPVYIVYKQAGDYRNVVRIETVDPAFKDIEF